VSADGQLEDAREISKRRFSKGRRSLDRNIACTRLEEFQQGLARVPL